MKIRSILVVFLVISSISLSAQLSKFGKPGPFTDKHTLYEYRKSTNQVTRLSDIPGEGRARAFGFVIGDKIYIGGGEYPNAELTTSFYEYDPAFQE